MDGAALKRDPRKRGKGVRIGVIGPWLLLTLLSAASAGEEGEGFVTRRYVVPTLEPEATIARIEALLSPGGSARYHEATHAIEVRDTPAVQYEVITLLALLSGERKTKLWTVRLRVASIDTRRLEAAGGTIQWESPPSDPPVGLLVEPRGKRRKKRWILEAHQLYLLNGKRGILLFRDPSGGSIHLALTPRIAQNEVHVEIAPKRFLPASTLPAGAGKERRPPLPIERVTLAIGPGENVVLDLGGRKGGLLFTLRAEILPPHLFPKKPHR
ncbi:MAG: hypothetical protein D6795_18385 [Deltaproteobacteria bacterium]|nr:MAG: hypothetical protein D6795_18385 [Deltaproteobacteria bacterium]